MRHTLILLAVGLCALAAGPARADIIFSDVEIESDLGPISVFTMGTGGYVDSIWFRFLEGAVGDDYEPLRSGSITVAYTAEADTDLLLDAIDFQASGEFVGSGFVQAELAVEDLESAGAIGSSSIYLSAAQQLPYLANIELARSSSQVRITQSFTFDAQDTAELDLASLDIIKHRLLQVPAPEPASLGLLAFGLLAVCHRR